jgi:Ca-activated chloride channel family protein
MRTQSRILNLVAAVIAASVTAIASAQNPQKQMPKKATESARYNSSWCKKKEDGSIECGSTTTLITIKVSVTDGSNRPITDLGVKEFYIAEDDVKQEIEFWFHDDSSLTFSLAFDISDYEPLKLMARQAARNFVRQIRSTDEVTIPQLKVDSEAVLGFAADERGLENALVEIPSNDKLVGLVAEAIKSTEKGRHPMGGAVVVITDGHSLSGTTSDRTAAYAILRQGAPIYFIILDDGHYMARSAAQSRVRQKRGLLTGLAAASGGLALVVKSEDDISAATEQIIHRLKSQYTLGYYPTNDIIDGSFRNVSVTVTPKDNRKVKAFALRGYYAVDPEKIREEKTNVK